MTSRSLPQSRSRIRVPPDDEPSPSVGPADMREPQEVEGLRLEATGSAVLAGEAPERNDPGLLGMQLQPEPVQPLRELGQEAPGIPLGLEAHHHVVGVAHHDHLAMCMPLPPLVDPEVVDIVQIDVGQERRDHRPLRRALLGRGNPTNTAEAAAKGRKISMMKLTDLPSPSCRSSRPFSGMGSPAGVAWQSP